MYANSESLTAEELFVIQRRYGVTAPRLAVVPDVGEEMGLTEARMSAVEVGALRKLRHMTLDSLQILRQAV